MPTANYRNTPGGIPIPATLSIELGRLITARNEAVGYRFVSDLPFKGRGNHNLDAFESGGARRAARRSKDDGDGSVRLDLRQHHPHGGPVMMGAPCVSCHNSHPESPTKDWKVGDVRGIQEITVHQPIAANILSFKYLLLYFALAGADRHHVHRAATAPAGRASPAP